MPLKDTFAYTARWDSVGLDCSYCSHFVGPAEWPDKARESRCRFHRISLAVEIGRNGYKEWEWFCKNFEDINTKEQCAYPPAVEHFVSIRNHLQDRILYRLHGKEGYLVEYPFEDIENSPP